VETGAFLEKIAAGRIFRRVGILLALLTTFSPSAQISLKVHLQHRHNRLIELPVQHDALVLFDDVSRIPDQCQVSLSVNLLTIHPRMQVTYFSP
jgi:hypothetical protein